MSRPDTLIHPVRMRIVQTIGARGAMSAKELRGVLDDVAHATLYRHVKALVQAGFLELDSERQARGAVERRYRLVGGVAIVGADDLDGASPEDHLRWFSGFTAILVETFARYTRLRPPDLVRDRVRYRLMPMHLTDSEADAFAEELEALCGRYRDLGEGKGRKKRSFGYVSVLGE